ncbi:unnamed protein product, partial [Closterium sp. Naga37s-1]
MGVNARGVFWGGRVCWGVGGGGHVRASEGNEGEEAKGEQECLPSIPLPDCLLFPIYLSSISALLTLLSPSSYPLFPVYFPSFPPLLTVFSPSSYPLFPCSPSVYPLFLPFLPSVPPLSSLFSRPISL